MQRILITGATGNVGRAIIHHFIPEGDQQLFAATREKSMLASHQLYFDFADVHGSLDSLSKTDVLFLLRPPQLADVNAYFKPLIHAAEEQGVRQVVFLSVQGAEKLSFIPHAKIEELLRHSQLKWTFIRPSYFMQNLTTTLLADIQNHQRIFLPAGKAPFLWVDVDDIGKAIARILAAPEKHHGQAYTITGREYFNFAEVARILSEELGQSIKYISPNLIRFYLIKRKEGVKHAFIMVMIMLHFLPRFQSPPPITDDFKQLTGDDPQSLRAFIQNHRQSLLNP